MYGKLELKLYSVEKMFPTVASKYSSFPQIIRDQNILKIIPADPMFRTNSNFLPLLFVFVFFFFQDKRGYIFACMIRVI